MARNATPRFRSVDSHSIAGGGPELVELIKLPTPIWIFLYVVRFPFKHRVFGLVLLTSILALFFKLNFFIILAMALTIALAALYLYTYARYSYAPTLPRLTMAIRRRWHVHKRWPEAMKAIKIKTIPKLRNVKYTPNGIVGKLPTDQGYDSEYVKSKAVEIAAVLQANEVKVDANVPFEANISIIWGDPTERILFPEDLSDIQNQDTDSVAFALDADHSPLSVSITTSLLIVGESESGKSNCFWSILNAMNEKQLPYKLWVIDPAGGVELDALQHAPNTLAYVATPGEATTLCEQAYEAMQTRLNNLKARGARKYDISEAEPVNIIVVDELLLLPSYNQYSPLGHILSSGRKAGYIVIALSQLSQIDALGRTRDLFPQRICHGTKSADVTDAALGMGAEAAGALCSKISKRTPGVGYFFSIQTRLYTRFRTPLISNANTRIIAQGNLIQRSVTGDSLTPKFKKRLGRRRTSLYRYYGEYRGELGRLLYVGIAYDPKQRWEQHCSASGEPWCPHDIDTNLTEIVWYPSRPEAKAAETLAIQTEFPVYNKQERNDYDRSVSA